MAALAPRDRPARARAVLTALGLLCLLLAGCDAPAAPSVATATPGPAAASTPAATQQPVTSVTKLLVFVEENHSLAEMKAGMPYAFGLARAFGYATNFVATRHPSLPNYIAIAGGKTYGIDNNHDPADNPIDGPSVFGNAIAAGRTAAVYADGMPHHCAATSGGTAYAVKHNPWPYFRSERKLCEQFNVSTDRLTAAIADGTLPHAGMVIPNLDHDAHDGTLGTADAWFKGWMRKIFAGPDWKSGRLAVVLTADEDNRRAGNVILTVLIHPSQRGNVVTTALTHYSLSRLYSEVTGTPALFNAKTAPSMAAAFGLPVR